MKRFLMIFCMFLLSGSLLSGCVSNDDISKLKTQVAQANKDIRILKDQIAKINNELDDSKPEEKESSTTPQPSTQPISKSISYSTIGITDDEKGFAWAVAQTQVKANLKAPSTAKFAKYADMPVSKSGNNFKVEGYVDAENSFGAKIRSNFTVEFEKTGKETYNLKNVSIE